MRNAALKSDKVLINLQLELHWMVTMHFYLVYQLTKQWEWKLGYPSHFLPIGASKQANNDHGVSKLVLFLKIKCPFYSVEHWKERR